MTDLCRRLLSVLVVSFLIGTAVVSTPVPAAAATCPCSVWPGTATPANTSDPDTAAVELGVKLRSDNSGFITGIRFYKPSGETSPHVVNLWTGSGMLLATASSAGETPSGWQQVNLSAPVAITAGTTYVASYHSNGRFAIDQNAFATAGVDNAPLHALQSGVDGLNGVYLYGYGFPTNSYLTSNYFVDAVFNDTANIPTPTPTPTATPSPVPTNTPTPGPPTATPTATNTPPPVTCPCTIWPSAATPVVAANGDTNAVEVGVKFRTDRPGQITAVRFYKGSTNTGTHVAHLWTNTGTLLATATFSGETSSGWQQVTFATPVAVTANTSYVASYHTDTGHYAADQNAFAAQGVVRGPLTALQSGVDGGNGVYSYTNSFPNGTYNATNYWVDVVFVAP
jgi:hypothetical protein